MRQIDMSAQAVTARLKLVSELRRFCLLLGTSSVKPNLRTSDRETNDSQQTPNAPERATK